MQQMFMKLHQVHIHALLGELVAFKRGSTAPEERQSWGVHSAKRQVDGCWWCPIGGGGYIGRTTQTLEHGFGGGDKGSTGMCFKEGSKGN